MATEGTAAKTSPLKSFVEENQIHTFRVGGVDIDGQWRAKRVPATTLLDGKLLSYSDVIFGWDIHDIIYTPNAKFTGWTTGWPDVRLVPDTTTARELPWEKGTASIICDYVSWEGVPVRISPRWILQRVTERCQKLGYEPKVAIELEFFVLRETPETMRAKHFLDLNYLTVGNHSYHAFNAATQLRDWMGKIQEYGVPVEGANTEWGMGQFEINIKYAGPVESADNVVMYKSAIKELAAQEGLTVTFMARLAHDQPGSSGHLHQSLWDAQGRTNLFWDEKDRNHMSGLMRQYCAGLLAKMRETAVMFLPSVNSYRRVLEYISSPTSVTWGIENRTTGLRAVPHTPTGCRIEHRTPGADSNPYLSVAAALAAGIHGIEASLEPPELLFGDGYAAEGVPKLPTSLEESVGLFEESVFAREAFGEEFVCHYASSRRWEINQFRQSVTDWERSRYLEVV